MGTDSPNYVDYENLSARDQKLIHPDQTVLDVDTPREETPVPVNDSSEPKTVYLNLAKENMRDEEYRAMAEEVGEDFFERHTSVDHKRISLPDLALREAHATERHIPDKHDRDALRNFILDLYQQPDEREILADGLNELRSKIGKQLNDSKYDQFLEAQFNRSSDDYQEFVKMRLKIDQIEATLKFLEKLEADLETEKKATEKRKADLLRSYDDHDFYLFFDGESYHGTLRMMLPHLITAIDFHLGTTGQRERTEAEKAEAYTNIKAAVQRHFDPEQLNLIITALRESGRDSEAENLERFH